MLFSIKDLKTNKIISINLLRVNKIHYNQEVEKIGNTVRLYFYITYTGKEEILVSILTASTTDEEKIRTMGLKEISRLEKKFNKQVQKIFSGKSE